MKTDDATPPEPADDEVAALIATLHETEQRLEALTGGEVDTVSDRFGRPYLLRRAQEELRDREADKQAAILNALPAHIALLDANGVIIAVNEPWRRFASANFLPAPAHGVGLNYLEVCDRVRGPEESDAHRTAAGIRAVLAGEKNFSIEYPCHSPTARRWFLLTVTPLTGGQAHGVVVMHLNITERRLAEDARRAAQKRLRDLIDGLGPSMMVGLMTPEGILVEANAPALAAVGLKPEDVIGQPLADSPWFAYSPEVRQQLRDAIARGLRGEASRYDMKIGGVGGLIDVEFALNPVRDESGTIVFLVPSGNVITERKRAETELQGKTALLEAQVSSSIDGILVVDEHGRKALQNQRMADLFGIPPHIAEDRDDSQQLRWVTGATKDSRQFAEKVAYLNSHRREISRDELELKSGATLDRYSAPVIGTDGKYYGRIWTFRDITERKRLDERLRQTQKMEAIGTLAGGIAHDFNNILAAIGGYTEFSRMILKDNPEVREHLGAVMQAASRATDLVKQILAFSRQQRLERRPIPLRPVVTECLALLRSTIPATIAFDVTLAPDAPTVLADATQVHQVLMNLGTNAWHAMRDRPGRLQVRLERFTVDAALAAAQPRLRPGDYARLSVGDTGCGMEPATLRRIFEPFFTTKAPGEGTGLGLSVVHGIMASHDGTVTVYSQPGEGTVFHLYFPAHFGKEAPAVAESAPVPRGHGERLLLVDDEESLAELGRQVLTTLGYEVVSTTKPEAALELVRAEPQRFALVLTDMSMPGMTGLALAEELLKLRPGLPIILTTGYSASLTPDRVREAGLCPLLLKPTTLRTLGTAVHAALQARTAIVNQ